MFVALALLATALPALAWNNSSQYLTGLGQALQDVGLTTLGSQTGRLNNSAVGRVLLARLVLGNYTLFAPDNEACESVICLRSRERADMVLQSPTPRILQVYLVTTTSLPSQYCTTSSQAISVLTTTQMPRLRQRLTRMSLSDVLYLTTLPWFSLKEIKVKCLFGVTLMVKSRCTTNRAFLQLYFGFLFKVRVRTSVSVQNSTVVENLLVNRINGLLIIPPNVSDVLAEQNLTYLAGFLDSTTITSSNGSNETITGLLDGDSVHGFTFFAPDNAAIELGGSSLTSVADNKTALLTILSNHVHRDNLS